MAAKTQKLTLPAQHAKTAKGREAYYRGTAAEASVERAYAEQGGRLLGARWRGTAGEIDLIFMLEETYVFCEVKAAPTFEAAMMRLQPTQMRRIHAAASEYLGQTPLGQLSDVRFDLACVNAQGEVRLLENAFGHF